MSRGNGGAGHAGYGRRAALGTIQVFAAQALILPTGLLTAGCLTRQLGPEPYGLLTVAGSIVVWVELSSNQLLGLTTVKFVAEAQDRRGAASALAQAQVLVGLAAGALLAVAAPVLAGWLKAPELALYLRLYALDIPLLALGTAHQSILTGQGDYGRRALPTAGRWLSRIALIFLFVGLGLLVWSFRSERFLRRCSEPDRDSG